jgi:predicted metal-dependent peptidase
MRGKDEYTYAKPNRRRLADDLYLPSTYSETVGEIIVGIDTSGSIGQADINRVGGRVSALCELYPPERIRVLWWDTRVHAEQTFEPSQYGDIVSLLKPVGGGGTRVGCVSEYIKTHVTHVDGVIVFTDGHVESQFNWDINAPTLWLVTQNKQFSPPAGITVMVKP